MLRKCKKSLSVVLSLLMLLPLFGCLTLPAAAADYNVGDIIEYGSYPQTRVTGATLLAALNSAPKSWASYRYYSGDGNSRPGAMEPGDWMTFSDFFYNGVKYRAVRFREYRPIYTYQQYFQSNTNLYNHGYHTNVTYYFKYEPLQWRVLDPSTGYVMCEKAIDSQAFREKYYYDANTATYYTDDGKTARAIDYSASSLRAWLNEDFFNTAFTDTQKANIRADKTFASPSVSDAAYDSPSVRDRISLLSYAEAQKTAYGFTGNENRIVTATDYAMSQGAAYTKPAWWLRNPGSGVSIECVLQDGSYAISTTPVSYVYAYATGVTVRPVCYLKTLKTDTSAADGLYSVQKHAAQGHSYKVDWMWEEDLSGASVMLKCPVCQAFTVTLTADTPTVTERAVTAAVTYDGHTFTDTVYIAPGNGDTFLFGSYPKTLVTDETLLAALDAAEKNWMSYGYYSGSGDGADGNMQPGDWMKFADLFYGGKKYRAVKIENYRPHIVWQVVGTSPVQPSNGYVIGTYYFLYEPLQWRVLDEDTGLVVCESIIDCQPFQNIVYLNDKKYYQGNSGAASNIYASAYATCTLRDWLNGQFYDTAFTAAQKENVLPTVVDNHTGNGSYASPDTTDDLFLLSVAELTNAGYGFADVASRCATGTDYAYSQGLNGPGRSGAYADCYWTRSVDPNTNHKQTISAARIYEKGNYDNESFVSDDYTGVRPACHMDELRCDLAVSPEPYSGLHTAVFSAEGNALTGTCSNEDCCLENNALSLILTAPEKTAYGDGKNAEATLANLESFNFEFGLALSADGIAYYQGETLLETAPEIPGRYTAVFTAPIGDETYKLTVDYVISNATPAPDALPGYTAVYGDMLSGITLPSGWSWNTPDARVGNVGVNTFTATYSTGNAYYDTVSQDVTVTVSRKILTVTPDAGLSKVYGDADPIYYTYTVEGLVEGDALPGALTRTAGENAGKYDYVVTTLSAGNNYNVVLAAGAPQFTITPKPLTVIADAKSKTYGEADPALTYTLVGELVGSDKVTGALTRTGDDNVGVYEIQQGTFTAGNNYDLTFTGASFTVGARVLTVTADAKSKTYGEADPELTYTVEGELVGSDTLTGALARTGNENAGTYAVTQGTLTAGDNYAISFTGADFTIEKKALTVTADAKSKTYGEADPELTYTAQGLVDGDTLSGALARTGDDNVGVYEIRQGTLTAGDNYDLTFTGADFTIGKKTLTVTADAKTKVYGDPDPKLTYKTDGLAAGDTVTVTLTRAPGKDAGVYAISAEIEAGENYDVVYVPADLTVTRRALTVKADAKSKEQGDADPALTYKVTGLQYDDTVTVTLTRAAGEEPGSYAITAVIDANDNYEVTYVGASFTVRAPQEYTECPFCGEIHNEKTFTGFFTRFIHLLLYVIKRINFHMFDYM